MTNEFIPYIIAVYHQTPARIYADDRYQPGQCARIMQEYSHGNEPTLADCHNVYEMVCEEDEIIMLEARSTSVLPHQHNRICQLIIERRIEIENQGS